MTSSSEPTPVSHQRALPREIDPERYVEALTPWLAAQGVPLAPPLRIGLISGGRSNLTLSANDADGNQFVVRRPPAGSVDSTAHDVLREAQILLALEPTAVPVPEVVARSDDTQIIGAPFYVMRFVAGHVLTRPEDTDLVTGIQDPGRVIATNAVRALAAVHKVDLDEVGLAGMRRPTSYVSRQLRRFEPTATAEVGPFGLQLRAVGELLGRDLPDESESRLLHGDFKLGNLIVDDQGEVRAVLDWELSSVGDPIADVGWLVASWAEPEDGPWIVAPATTRGGYPSRSEIADAYAAATGRPLDRLDYYIAFAYWRWSCINLRTRRRLLEGTVASSTLTPEQIDGQIEWQLERARTLLDPRVAS